MSHQLCLVPPHLGPLSFSLEHNLFLQLPHHTWVFIQILQQLTHNFCSGMLELLRQWYLHVIKHDKQIVNKCTSVDFTTSETAYISIKTMSLGFMCQVLYQHPCYSHSPDRKNHPKPDLKTRFLTHCRHSHGCFTSLYHSFLHVFTRQHCLGLGKGPANKDHLNSSSR